MSRTSDRGGDLLTVSEVASRAHVTVRALHHYDEIGLLRPSERSAAGYRLYDRGDLERLHQVLLFRELGVRLDSIRELLEAGPDDRRIALLAHRGELESRRRRTAVVIRAVDQAIDALERGHPMSGTELFEGFEDFDHAQYADEAEERWGDTDAFRESQRRVSAFNREDWTTIKAEAESILERMAALMRDGGDPGSPEAMALAEEHRHHISRFYDCPPRMHEGLAQMYESDPRFTAYFEKRGEGLTAFASAAIRANAAARMADSAD